LRGRILTTVKQRSPSDIKDVSPDLNTTVCRPRGIKKKVLKHYEAFSKEFDFNPDLLSLHLGGFIKVTVEWTLAI